MTLSVTRNETSTLWPVSFALCRTDICKWQSINSWRNVIHIWRQASRTMRRSQHRDLCRCIQSRLAEGPLSVSFQGTKKTRSATLVKYQMQFTGVVNPKSFAKIVVPRRKLVNEFIKINLLKTRGKVL